MMLPQLPERMDVKEQQQQPWPHVAWLHVHDD
jgi:hypothetical protein